MKILNISEVWNETRPKDHRAYDGHDLGSLPLYQYRAIRPGQFRLLHLQPGTGRDEIRFELEIATRGQCQKYETVSYCWGEIKPSCNILCNGTRLPVTKNGADALWHFRLTDRPRVIWMDAVCINQSSDDDAIEERNEQVANMHEIYSNAEHTLAWAGNESRAIERAFSFLKDVLSLVKTEIISQVKQAGLHERNQRVKAAIEGRADSDWATWSFLYMCFQNLFTSEESLREDLMPLLRFENAMIHDLVLKQDFDTQLALRKLCDRQYFHRCWVLQELVLSKHSTLYVGKYEMSWDDFSAMLWIISRLSNSIPGFRQAATPLTQMKTQRTFRSIHQEGFATFSLLQPILNSCGLMATKAVDRIYAIRNLASPDARKEAITVDYKKPLVDTYVEAGRSLMGGTARQKAEDVSFLLIYNRFTFKQQKNRLPSWIPDFDILRVGDMHILVIYYRFHAGGDFEQLASAYLPSENLNVLALRGRITDTVSTIAKLEPLPFIESDMNLVEFQDDHKLFRINYAIPSWRDFDHMISPMSTTSRWEKPEIQELMFSKIRDHLSATIRRLQIIRQFAGEDTSEETFWRAVQTDMPAAEFQRVPKDKPFPAPSAKLFLDAIPSLAEPSNWNGSHPVFQAIDKEEMKKNYWFFMNTEHWRNARFGRTSQGQLAWLPLKSEPGDSICVFGGSTTFHVVRPDGNGRWKIIGPAYVHGLMDGEALTNKLGDDEFIFIS